MVTATNFFINILLAIDSGIYWLAAKAYELLLAISEVKLFNEDSPIANFADRIYILLGIFMLFKVSFSLLKYVVSPDDFADSQKGIGKLVKNTMICLILIVAVPYIFDYSQRFQQAILNENVIPNLVLGMGAQAGETLEYGDEGVEVAFLTFSAFFTPNKAIFQDNDDCRKNAFQNPESEGLITLKEECAEIINQASGSSYEKPADVYETAFRYSSIGVLTDTDLFKSMSTVNDEKIRTFDYKFVVSTIAGGFLAWIFVMFCFDIAVRVVKLAFLQIVAPIPIISYIEPKGKDGMFKKWVSECVKTYLSLFIRLIAIFFAIFIISKIGSMEYGERGYDTLVYIFIVFGTLLFAKQIPKLIENIAGVKMDGDFTLNPMNKMRQMPILGHVAASAGGTAAGAYAGLRAARELGQNGFWGAWRGGIYGNKEASRKIGWGGGDGKRVDAFSNASNRAMRELTGHDMAQFSSLKYFGQSKAKAAIEQIKEAKKAYGNAINERKTELSAVQNTKSTVQEKDQPLAIEQEATERLIDQLQNADRRGLSFEERTRLDRQLREARTRLVDIKDQRQPGLDQLSEMTKHEKALLNDIDKFGRNIDKLSKIQAKREVASGIPEQNIDDLNDLVQKSKGL